MTHLRELTVSEAKKNSRGLVFCATPWRFVLAVSEEGVVLVTPCCREWFSRPEQAGDPLTCAECFKEFDYDVPALDFVLQDEEQDFFNLLTAPDYDPLTAVVEAAAVMAEVGELRERHWAAFEWSGEAEEVDQKCPQLNVTCTASPCPWT